MGYVIGNKDGYLADKETKTYTLFPIYAQIFKTKEEAEDVLRYMSYDLKVISTNKLNGFYVE